MWPGDPRPATRVWATIEANGYALNRWAIGEHTGTHLGAPAHFTPGGPTVDQLAVEHLVGPCAMIDARDRAERDPDYALSVDDLIAWEARHGPIPRRSFVLLGTGWDRHWSAPDRYFNVDDHGVMHFPGFSPEAAAWLLNQRDALGLGIDTPGVDPGCDTSFATNERLSRAGRIHLENLCQVTQLPPQGAWLVIGALPLVGGSGSPARVLALIP